MSLRRRVSTADLESPRTRRIAVTALVLALLVATVAAFAVAQRLKLERAPVTAPRFERLVAPTCGCPKRTAELRITLQRADRLDASIVDAAGDHVRALATDLARRRGAVRFTWDGRDDGGDVVRDGLYRLRLRLRREDRTILVPTAVRVDATPPRVLLDSATPDVFSPDGDGRSDRVLYRYRASEAGRAHVYVDGEYTVRGRFWAAGPGRVRWRARRPNGLARPGTYTTWITVIDPAGNESERSRPVKVRIRYVDLRERRIVLAGRTLAFTADADSRTVAWALRRAGRRAAAVATGVVPPGPVSLQLPSRLSPGRYVLRIRVGKASDRAAVVVAR